MTVPLSTVIAIVGPLLGALATVIGILFWELRKCAQARVDDAKAYAATVTTDAKAYADKALAIQDRVALAVDKLATLVDAQQRRMR